MSYITESLDRMGAENPEVKVGDTIKIIAMRDEPHYTGKVGVINLIDDIGQLHGSWGGLAVIPDVDVFTVIKNEGLEEDLDEDKELDFSRFYNEDEYIPLIVCDFEIRDIPLSDGDISIYVDEYEYQFYPDDIEQDLKEFLKKDEIIQEDIDNIDENGFLYFLAIKYRDEAIEAAENDDLFVENLVCDELDKLEGEEIDAEIDRHSDWL